MKMKLKPATIDILVAAMTNAVLARFSFSDLILSALIFNLVLVVNLSSDINRKKKKKRKAQEQKEK
jgi:hypothetical protein